MATHTSKHVAVIGAGAFGTWTALALTERGARVTLLDAWGPGNVRASSGGSTRVIRATYGSHRVFTRMAAEALGRWQEYDARWKAGLLHQTGAVWLFSGDDQFGTSSAASLQAEGISLDDLSVAEAAKRYPQMSFDDVARVLFEPAAGYLESSRACRHVAGSVAASGGSIVVGAAASPVRVHRDGVELVDGSRLEADSFVFACGPWLASLFPDVVGDLVQATRQEVYYFGQPAGDAAFQSPALPVWLDCGERFIYGIPGDGRDGFKAADDTPGPAIDPTSDSRQPSGGGIEAMRTYLARRFPALTGAPLVRSEVCQYESTPDAHFVIDRHPSWSDVWIVGGGSGHGFKMGPVVGDRVAALVLEEASPDPRFALARFASPPAGGWQPKWA